MSGKPREVSLMDIANAYKIVFATPEGQVVLADLVRKFAFNTQSTFVPNCPEQTNVNEGQRTVIVHIGRMQAMDANQVAEIEKGQSHVD